MSKPVRRWGAYAVALGASIATMLDTSKVTVGLPEIAKALNASTDEIQLTVAAYTLALGVVTIPAGRLGDEWSRKRLFIIGLLGFLGTSVVCWTAPTAEILVGARVLEGFAAGILTPQVIGLIQELFPAGPERAKAFGYFGAISGIALAIGPFVGGLLVDSASDGSGWRWIFFINLPMGLICLIFALWLLPEREVVPRVSARSLDPVGSVLLALGILGVMLPFMLQNLPPAIWLLVVVGATFIAAFIRWEQRKMRSAQPVVMPLRLFGIRAYSLGAIIGFTSFAAVGGIILTQTLYAQDGLGLSAVMAGLITIPFSVGASASSWVATRVLYRVGARIVLLGVSILLLGCLIMAAAVLWAPVALIPWLLAAGQFVSGIGGGFNVTGNQVVMLDRVPVADAGVAGSVGGLAQRVGTAVGQAVVSAMFFATLGAALRPSISRYDNAYFVALGAACVMVLVAVVMASLDRTKLAAPGTPALEEDEGAASRALPGDEAALA